ncbi:MAG: hypothetical protein GY778_08835 [bacterium]|nr:hypothetical protein [bacterium]
MAVDPEFVTTLSADIQGIFWPQAAKYTASEIEEQFREAVQDGQLMGNEGFVTNLMFIVRKREVVALREDVFKEYRVGRLPREARMSTLKTAYALGGRQEREAIDGWLAQTLRSEYESSNRLTGSRHLDVADRVGGGDTLDVMKDLLPQAVRAQQDAEAEPSPDFTS